MSKKVVIEIPQRYIVSEGYAYGTLRCVGNESSRSSEGEPIPIEKLRKRAKEVSEEISRTYQGSEVLKELGEVYVMILGDPLLWDKLEKREKDGKISIRDVFEVRDYIVSLLVESGNPLIRERTDDIMNIFNKLVSAEENLQIRKGDVVYVEKLYPLDVVHFYRVGVGAILSREGSHTSHAAILAKSLEIPYMYGVPSLEAYCDSLVFVDALAGRIVVNPSNERGIKETILRYEEEKKLLEDYSKLRFEGLNVMANVGFLQEIEIAKKKGADGIGLFRTEFLFLNRDEPPSENEQFLVYKHALETFSPDRVVVRLLDVGGDKGIPYLELPREENPFLGVRGIRALIQNEDIFLTQLRALLRASPHGNLGILIPMVSKPSEVDYVRKIVEKIASELEIGELPDIGIMVEVPSVILSLDRFLGRVDFMSIGTNDLTQYLFAADRMSQYVSDYYNDEDEVVLKAIRLVVEGAKSAGIPVGICGELAGKVHMVKRLVEIGVTSLSVSSSRVPLIKKAVYEMKKGSE